MTAALSRASRSVSRKSTSIFTSQGMLLIAPGFTSTRPVVPTVTATVTMEQMDTYRAPPKGFFEVPKDFKMGAYIERGFLRQL